MFKVLGFDADVRRAHTLRAGIAITIEAQAYQNWASKARRVDAVLAQLELAETDEPTLAVSPAPQPQKENPTDVSL